MMISVPSNASLVRQTLRGRRDRFDVLVRRHLRAVHAVAMATTANHADADDVTQDAFLRAYKSLDSLREPAKFEGWVITITRNVALKVLERRARERRHAEQAVTPEASEAVDLGRRELYGLLGEKLQGLDGAHREVLTLHYFAGKRTREIAKLLDISQAAVLKRLQRARAALGGELIKEIAEWGDEAPWIDKRAKGIAKHVIAAGTAWTAAKMGGGVAFGSMLSSGPVVVTGVILVACVGMALTMWANPGGDSESGRASALVLASAQQEQPRTDQVAASTEPEDATERPADSASRELEEEPREAVEPVRSASAVEANSNTEVDLVAMLQRPTGLVFKDIHLWDVLDFIIEMYGVPFLIDSGAVYVPDEKRAAEDIRNADVRRKANAEREYYTDGMLEPFTVGPMTLPEILDELCGSLGLSYVSEPAYIWISTADLIANEVKLVEGESHDIYANVERAESLLAMDMDARDTHIDEILDMLRDTYSTNFVLDYGVVRPHMIELPLYFGDVPPGYTSDGWIAQVHTRQISLEDTLEALLRPLELTYEVRDDVVVISSAERLAQPELIEDALQTADVFGARIKGYRSALREVQ